MLLLLVCPIQVFLLKGYAEESKLQYKQLLIKNPNYNRSFIMPDQESRQKVCNNKFKIDRNSWRYKGENSYFGKTLTVL